MHVAHHLVLGRARSADRHHRELLVEQRDRAVLQLAARGPLSVHVGDLLQLQSAFERNRVAQAATEVNEVAIAAVAVGDLRDLLLAIYQLTDLIWEGPERCDELTPSLERDATIHCGQTKAEQAEADHVGGQRLRRRNSDLGSSVEVDGAISVARRRAGKHVRDRNRESSALLGSMEADER